MPRNLGRGLPLPPHPQIDPIYTVCEKWTKNLGRALTPLIWTKSKEQLLFFGKSSLTLCLYIYLLKFRDVLQLFFCILSKLSPPPLVQLFTNAKIQDLKIKFIQIVT